jgi:hypothetical protein
LVTGGSVKAELVDLSSPKAIEKIRHGLLYQVDSPKYPSFRGEAYFDEFDILWFRPWPAPDDPAKDYRVHVSEITRLFFLNYMLPGGRKPKR